MITPIPPDASKVEYQANGHCANYYVWRRKDSYYWEALGNNGEASSFQAACTAARAWIRDRETI